jgi:hypothetical protein
MYTIQRGFLNTRKQAQVAEVCRPPKEKWQQRCKIPVGECQEAFEMMCKLVAIG